jgi:hypothetical protein
LSAAEENGGKKSAMKKKIFFSTKFFTTNTNFVQTFFLVSCSKFCEVKSAKRKKSKILLLHNKNGGESLTGYTLVIHTAPTVNVD